MVIPKAMILAAGSGSRLRPLTDRIPKCMIPIGGKPLLEHTICHLAAHGVTDIVINLSYLPEVIPAHFGDGRRWDVRIVYSQEPSPLGTAGAVRHAAQLLDGPFFLWYGDNLSRCDLERLYALHRGRNALATIALFEREEVGGSGIIGLDENDRIVRFMEKPRPEQVFSHWVNAGIYVLESSVIGFIPEVPCPDFGRDVFPALLHLGYPLVGYRLAADEGLWWVDTPDDLVRTQEALMIGGGAR